MKIQNTSIPVLILNCKLGALAIMRSLGGQGVRLYGVDDDRQSAGFLSRYCRCKFLMRFDEQREREYLEHIIRLGKEIGEKTILIPTSDELSLFVAKYYGQLCEYFIFPRNDHILVSDLINKEGMYHLARKHAVPTPYTVFPKKLDDVIAYAKDAKFPVMLKGIYGNRLQIRTNKKMIIVHSNKELVETYKKLEEPDFPNLMIQEYIPGDDDQIYIFNGYFNDRSECLAAFTGHKIRQFPVHVGCASLGICKWNKTVADITTDFMRSIGYQGILDIGYRLDPRDGLYKVLDINPRVGQAFRLFVSENDMDVVKSLYLDLTGQKMFPIIPREGRRWVIEDFDIISSFHYYQEGTLKLGEWLRSFRRLEEGAWLNWKDPFPFLMMSFRLVKRSFAWLLKKIGISRVS
jgi:predicted ATP-grasp superfamily ATP-dependent carboligase